MDALTINEAAETTGWSPRMLRYVESAGLVEPPRSPAGYRLFGPGELQRLRTLRELLDRLDCALSDVAFAKRLRADAGCAPPSTTGSRSVRSAPRASLGRLARLGAGEARAPARAGTAPRESLETTAA